MALAKTKNPADWLKNNRARKPAANSTGQNRPAKAPQPLFINPFDISDLAVFDSPTLRAILSQAAFGVSLDDLALSLHGTSKRTFNRIARKLSRPARAALKNNVRRPAPVEEVEAARSRVLDGLFWELTYWKTPELYEELTEGERLHPGIFKSLSREIRGQVVADVGAGSGRATFEALRQGARQVVAIEPSPGLLNILSGKLAGQPAARKIIPVQGRFDALPLADNSVDLALACSAFTAEPEQGGEPGLNEMRRITRPGGTIVIIWPRLEDRAWLAEHGFKYVALSSGQEMKVKFRSLNNALRIARRFYARNKQVARYLLQHRRPEVPFSVLGFNPPIDYCWLEVKK